MKFIISVFLVWLFAFNAWSCSYPISGEKYDRQIQIAKLDEKDSYKFQVPLAVEGLTNLEVMLGYSRTDLDGFRMLEKQESLEFNQLDGVASGTFKIKNIKGYLPYLHVVWWPNKAGLCGVVANSEFIGASET